MSSFDDLFAELGDEVKKKKPASSSARPAKKKQTKPSNFVDPLAQIDDVQAARVTGIPESRVAGQFVRQTVTIPPAQFQYIRQLAKNEGFGILAFYRWLLDQGLQAYDSGARPEATIRTHGEPVKGHWTSRNE